MLEEQLELKRLNSPNLIKGDDIEFFGKCIKIAEEESL